MKKNNKKKRMLYFKIVLMENINFKELNELVNSIENTGFSKQYEGVFSNSSSEIGFYKEVDKDESNYN